MERARTEMVRRRREGLHDGLQFTYKNIERATDPRRAVTSAQAVIVGARSYWSPGPEQPPGPAARVARYAWADHYTPLREGLWAVARQLRRDGWKAVAYADDNSIVDREAAYLAGIGWFGKNANVLLPGAGSWFVLGCVVTTAPLPTAAAPVADGCGACTRCIPACPTSAIVAPGVIDASRCLAWVLQKPGDIPEHLREAVDDRIYGCDDCQDVCPPSVRFGPRQPAPDHLQGATRPEAWVDVLDLLDATDDEVLARWGRWYLADREPRWLRRNALVVLGNRGQAGDPRVRAALARYLADTDPVLRSHAAWAADRLGLAP
jgi:epoxyqueuosine reductase